MKKKIIHYFNQGANTYDSVADIQVYVANQLASRLRNQSANQVLEVGCGTGLLSQYLPLLYPQASLLLTDIAPNMLKKCKERFTQTPRVTVAHMDGEECRTDYLYDLIVSSMTMHWFENLKESINRLIDKLLPSGCLIFAMPVENSLHEWHSLCRNYEINKKQNFPNVQDLQRNFPDLQIEIEKKQYDYDSPYDFIATLKNSGTRASNSNQNRISINKMRKLLKTEAKKFTVTYEIMYGCYLKK